MFANLDTLPAGKSLYTVHVTNDPEGTARSAMSTDEVDVTYDRNATWGEIGSYARVHPTEEHLPSFLIAVYGHDSRIVGIVNQSDGYVVFDAFAAGIETGANDL